MEEKMKWKKEVDIKKGRECWVCFGEKKSKVAKKVEYILEAIQEDITDEIALINLIIKKEKTNDIIAGLILSQFILDYQEYLEMGDTHYEII